jgi:hypothetical protein
MASSSGTVGGEMSTGELYVKLEALLGRTTQPIVEKMVALEQALVTLTSDSAAQFAIIKESIAEHGSKAAEMEQRLRTMEQKMVVITRQVLGPHEDIDPHKLSLYADPEQFSFEKLKEIIEATLASKRMSIAYSMKEAPKELPPRLVGKVKPFKRGEKTLQLFYLRIAGGEPDRRDFVNTVGPVLRGMDCVLLDVLTQAGKDLKLARKPVAEHWAKQPGVTAVGWVGARIRITQNGEKKFLTSYEVPATNRAPA